MEEIIFKIQGSAPETYVTTFKKDGANFTATCTCPAGEVGQYCKHRIRIIEGSVEGIVSRNEEEVKRVVSWLPGTDVEKALSEVRAAEGRLEAAKKELSALKKKLARVLQN